MGFGWEYHRLWQHLVEAILRWQFHRQWPELHTLLQPRRLQLVVGHIQRRKIELGAGRQYERVRTSRRWTAVLGRTFQLCSPGRHHVLSPQRRQLVVRRILRYEALMGFGWEYHWLWRHIEEAFLRWQFHRQR